MAEETEKASLSGWLRRHGPWLLAVALIPLLFHFTMVVQNQEPPAPDTQAVRPLLNWAVETERDLGTLPLWCPSIFGGMPSYGSFIYTPAPVHRPFDAVVRPFKEQRGVRYYLAMLLGGFALYALGLRLGFKPAGAACGSLLFVLTPYMAGVIQAGHSTKLRALYHVPLLFLAVEEGLRRPRWLAAALLALALALLGWTRHPQIAYYALSLAALYAVLRLVFLRPDAWRGRGWAAGVGLVLLAVLLTAGMLADPFASVMEYTPYSVRGDPGVFAESEDVSGGTPWDYATAWSFHPEEIISFVVPEWFGLEGATYWGRMPFTQSTHYFGVVAFALAVLSLVWVRGRRLWIWAALALVVLVIGFGRFVPILYRPMFEILPFFNKFRVPSMIYSLLPLLLVPLVGEALRFVQGDGLAGASAPKEKRGKGKRDKKTTAKHASWVLPATAAVAILLILWIAAAPSITDSLRASPAEGKGWFLRADDGARYGHQNLPPLMDRRAEMFRAGVTRTLLLLTVLGIVLELRRRKILPGVWAAALLGILVVGDLWVVGKKFQKMEPKAKLEQAYRPDEALRYLNSVDGVFRILPLDDPGSNLHASLGLQSIMGYQPAKLRAYQDLVDAGCLQRSQAVLDMLQTRFLVTSRDLSVPGYDLVHSRGRKVYERQADLPRAWLVTRVQSFGDARDLLQGMSGPVFQPYQTAFVLENESLAAGDRSQGTARLRSWSEHLIEVDVEVEPRGEGLLVFSEMSYPPGWRCEVDGSDASIHRVNHALMAVTVPPGKHDVRLRAHPGARTFALPVSQVSTVVTILILLAMAFLGRRR
jgi:hypothetical protein